MDKKYLKRTIIKRVMDSHHLQDKREILVYMPPDYDNGSQYPVLYLQDGDDYFNLGRFATQANRLILDGLIQPIVAVAIPVKKENRTSEYSPVGERHQAYLRFMGEELLSMVEDEFPVSPSPRDRVLGGSSLGATVSLHLALEYPLLFENILSQSGAYLEQSLERVREIDTLSHLEIYLSIGKEEVAVPTHMGKLDLLARNREVFRVLLEKGAKVHYSEQEGDHTWGFWQRDLVPALKTFFGK